MDRVKKIVYDEQYLLYTKKNEESELNRTFCLHNFNHLLNVARLTYLLLLETSKLDISKDVAYAAGLLHDIGRWQEYATGCDHALSSANLARPILIKAGYNENEMNLISEAILQHRKKGSYPKNNNLTLQEALQKADNLSRTCFNCSVRDKCKTLDLQYNAENLVY